MKKNISEAKIIKNDEKITTTLENSKVIVTKDCVSIILR